MHDFILNASQDTIELLCDYGHGVTELVTKDYLVEAASPRFERSRKFLRDRCDSVIPLESHRLFCFRDARDINFVRAGTGGIDFFEMLSGTETSVMRFESKWSKTLGANFYFYAETSKTTTGACQQSID
jgi:hypothetical protein